jgi:hypothetical protein
LNKFIVCLSLIIIVLIASYSLYRLGGNIVKIAPEKAIVPQTIDNTTSTIKKAVVVKQVVKTPIHAVVKEQDFDVWLNNLEKAESCPKIGIVDVNGYRSYGSLCFQRATYLKEVKHFKLFPNATSTKQLLVNLADKPTQYKLAKYMISEDYNAWRNWQNSVLGMWVERSDGKIVWKEGIGLPPNPNDSGDLTFLD